MTGLRFIVYSAPLKEFDFERTARTMEIMNWVWLPEGVPPSAEKLRTAANELARKLGTEMERPDGSKFVIREVAAGALVAFSEGGEVFLALENVARKGKQSKNVQRLNDAWETAGREQGKESKEAPPTTAVVAGSCDDTLLYLSIQDVAMNSANCDT
jgi:hypothetical protein